MSSQYAGSLNCTPTVTYSSSQPGSKFIGKPVDQPMWYGNATSMADCQSKCNNIQGCQGVTYNTSLATCGLYDGNAVSGSGYNSNYVSASVTSKQYNDSLTDQCIVKNVRTPIAASAKYAALEAPVLTQEQNIIALLDSYTLNIVNHQKNKSGTLPPNSTTATKTYPNGTYTYELHDMNGATVAGSNDINTFSNSAISYINQKMSAYKTAFQTYLSTSQYGVINGGVISDNSGYVMNNGSMDDIKARAKRVLDLRNSIEAKLSQLGPFDYTLGNGYGDSQPLYNATFYGCVLWAALASSAIYYIFAEL